MKSLGVRYAPCQWKFPHLTTKRGPAGQALLTSITEVTLLPQQLKDDIILLGGSGLANVLEALTDRLDILGWGSVSELWAKHFPAKTKSLRKISFFSDKEGKTRVIALLDYWSQTCLRPLHDSLNRCLRRISTDCTFNQNRFLDVLPYTGPYHSLDLTAATDRMPIALQQRVIARVIGQDRAEAWARILTSYEFTISKSSQTVKYGAGQPMGAYSSWPAMALTHHVIVRVAALRAGLSPDFSLYALLGDDIVIADNRVAENYRLLCVELDMPLSEQKTHVSYDTYEFAKRWIHKGEEVTGFAVGALLSVWRSYPLLYNFLENQQHHGWSVDIGKHPDLILVIYKAVLGPKFIYERCERVCRLYKLHHLVSKEIKPNMVGQIPEHVLKEIAPMFGFTDILQRFSPSNALKWGFLLAKRRLVMKDLESFQRDAYVVNQRLYDIAYGAIPSSADQAQRDFLKETIPVMVNWDNPLVLVLNRLIDDSMDLLCCGLSEHPGLEFYLEAGLNKYFVSKNVFSMKASSSKVLAESAVNKQLLKALSELDKGLVTPEEIEAEISGS